MNNRFAPAELVARTAPLARSAAAALLLALFLAAAALLTSCYTFPEEKVKLTGDWFGYLSLGQSTGGYNEMSIDGNKNCILFGRVSGDLEGWGPYTLIFEGEPEVLGSRMLGVITITRYRAGIDTLEAMAYWSGDIDLELGLMYGIWKTEMDQPWYADGPWGANKR
jgi:hypothetical protein